MTQYLYSSTEALVDSVYPVVVVDFLEAGGSAAPNSPHEGATAVLETNTSNVYRLRFHDKINSGRGEPDDAAVIFEKSTSESTPTVFTWPIEYIRRYGCETKNLFILELGRRCAGFPNKIIRFDTRPAKASALEADFGRLVKKVLKFMDPAAKLMSIKTQQQQSSGATAFFSNLMKSQSAIRANAVSCEYAELAPYEPPKPGEQHQQEKKTEPSTHYARIIVKDSP